MTSLEAMRDIFEKVTEYYQMPIRIGSRCEANVFYRVEDLTQEDLKICASYIADRVLNVCQPGKPERLVNLYGGYTEVAKYLARELGLPGEPIDVVSMEQLNAENGRGKKLKNQQIVLISDVITTARSCLEAHAQTTMMGATVLCWAALIDRTFGPGPVPVVACMTGEPVRLLE